MAATVSICLSLWVSDIQGCWLNLLILSILDVEYVLVCVFSLRTSRSRCWKGSSTACWGSGKGESSSLTHLPFQTAYFVMYLQNVIFYLISCGFKLKLDNSVIWICRIKFCLCVLGKATRSQTDMILLCSVFRPRTKDDLRAYFILVQVRMKILERQYRQLEGSSLLLAVFATVLFLPPQMSLVLLTCSDCVYFIISSWF